MAGRGRGGRGGWRGRGARGAGPQRLMDEDGQQVLTGEEGPPKLFPDIELPPSLAIKDQDKIQMLLYRDSLRQFQGGPYFMNKRQDRQRGFEDEAAASAPEPGAPGGGAGADGKAALAFMALDSRYLPEELYTEKDKRQAARGARSAGLSFRGAAGADAGLSNFLSARADQEEKAAGAAAAGDGEDAADAGPPQEPEDTDSMPEDDDYYQGDHFDDDEGYDEEDGGGGGGDDAWY